MTALALALLEPERRCAGPGFASSLDPGSYTSSFVIIPADGPAVRVSSLVVPAFGGDLCRVRVEPLVRFQLQRFGSLFEPNRRGSIYAMSPDRGAVAARPPDQPGWSYEGASLSGRLGHVGQVRLLRERVRGGEGEGAFSWMADRGLCFTSAQGDESLLLAVPGESEAVVLVSPPGLYRTLLDPAGPAVPGAGAADLLGYGDWAPPVHVAVELEPLSGKLLTGRRRPVKLDVLSGRPLWLELAARRLRPLEC